MPASQNSRVFCSMASTNRMSMRDLFRARSKAAAIAYSDIHDASPGMYKASALNTGCECNSVRAMVDERLSLSGVRANEVQVSATGEVSLPPDRCKIAITISSRKERAQDVKNSVARRLDYIMQTLHNHKVTDSNIQCSRVLHRHDDKTYQYDVQVAAEFTDFDASQTVCNFLVEKLDENVRISGPEYYHSQSNLENLGREAGTVAVKNAKHKAEEMSRCLGISVGRVICVTEDYSKEWQGTAPADSNYVPVTAQQKLTHATVTAAVKVTVTFEMRTKKPFRINSQ